MKTILVPVDFSETTRGTVDAAVALAISCQARLVVVHFIPAMPGILDYGPNLPDYEEYLGLEQSRTRRRLSSILREIRAQGIDCVSKGLCGPAVEGILALAKEEAADLVVMGSRRHGSLYNLVLGSTAQGVLERAECPVMLVPWSKKAVAAQRQPAAATTPSPETLVESRREAIGPT